MADQEHTSRNVNCTATPEDVSCTSCRKLAATAVRSELSNNGINGAQLGVLTDAVTVQVNSVVEVQFPARKVVVPEYRGLVSCESRRNVVGTLAVELAQATIDKIEQ